MPESTYSPGPADIAIIGMACRVPGARNIDEFWTNLKNGVESLVSFSDEEILASGVDPRKLHDPEYVKAGMPLPDMKMFDNGFFGLSPKEAAIMDPQHRQFLECAWEALEHSGYTPDHFNGPIGVFAGSGMNAYFMFNVLSNRTLVNDQGLFLLRHTGNDKDFLATRISYQMNLTGPSISVQTACSTSLVAIHVASQSLISRECDIALAGGVTIELPERAGYQFRENEILSRDGHCRAFDSDATGTIFGSGVGIVVLKRAEEAVRDGDTIHAIIRGSAVSNDGSSKVGYLAPSVNGVAKTIAEAMSVAGVSPDEISYIETHGTGTAVGDPIEVKAMSQAFGEAAAQKQFCGIGSVKTNIGHLDTAAGVVGLIKTVLALKHRQIPPSLHFRNPNPVINFEESPFYVNDRLRDWSPTTGPLRAGVTSLGVGGTNAHIVLEEAPALPASPTAKAAHVLTISARTPKALNESCKTLAGHLERHPELNIADVAHTTHIGRRAFRHRRSVLVRNLQDAVHALTDGASPAHSVSGEAGERPRSIVFMFPGGGVQYPDMGRELYDSQPVYRDAVDHCLSLVRRKIGLDLGSHMFPDAAHREAAAVKLEQPLCSVLSVFVTEYALARLLISLGVVPRAMTGHSLGEYTAACLAGVMSLEDALSIVIARGQIFEKLPEGAMTSVALSEEQTRKRLPNVAVAAVNSPMVTVISGTGESIANAERILDGDQIPFTRIRISVAAHSDMLDPYLESFRATVAKVALHPPSIPLISNLTGTWTTSSELVRPDYWVNHLRNAVRFSKGVETLAQEPDRVFLEVGPGTTLESLVKQIPSRGGPRTTITCLPHAQDRSSALETLLMAVGRTWALGNEIRWESLYADERRSRVPLPSYPFEHQSFWIEPAPLAPAGGANEFAGSPLDTSRPNSDGSSAPQRHTDLADWFTKPVWEKSPLRLSGGETSALWCWLVLVDELGVGKEVVSELRSAGHDVVTATVGSRFEVIDEYQYRVPLSDPEGYVRLVSDLLESGRIPQKIVHCWALRAQAPGDALGALGPQTDRCFFSLIHLIQALGQEDVIQSLDIAVLSTGAFSVAGENVAQPEAGLSLGPVKVIPREFPGVTCRLIDILPERGVASEICRELQGRSSDVLVAYRGPENERWVERYARTEIHPDATARSLRRNGVYLITGGLGGLGLLHAEYLAKKQRARLALLTRKDFPKPEQWSDWIRAHGERNSVSRTILKLREFEEAGSEVMVITADVTRLQDMEHAVGRVRERFGTIHGVLHAAGKLDDGVIQLRSRERSEAVLGPKVRGTLVLDRVFRAVDLDFMLLFSSVSAVLGPEGQADYVAANAFMDAYAQSQVGNKRRATIALSWGVWHNVGMAAEARARFGRSEELLTAQTRSVGHPLLMSCIETTPTQTVYSSQLEARGTWVLDEHRVLDDSAVLPGTGYLEMIRAGMEDLGHGNRLQMRNVSFLSPMSLEGAEGRTCRTTFVRTEDGFQFSIGSSGGSQEPWSEHAQGIVEPFAGAEPAPRNLAEIRGRCAMRKTEAVDGVRFCQEQHIRFGPRWHNLKWIQRGSRESLAYLELAPAYAPDLGTFPLHPALFDMATSHGLELIDPASVSDGLFVPVSYDRICVWAPLTDRLFSHAVMTQDDVPDPSIVTFDVTLMDSSGRVLVLVDGFTMQRVEAPAFGSARKTAASSRPEGNLPRSPEEKVLDSWIERGILPDEGTEIFRRVVSSVSGPQVCAAPLRLDEMASQMKATARNTDRLRKGTAGPFEDDFERDIALLWSEALGHPEIGAEDDFFELGGHSLVAVRIFTKIKKLYKADLSLATLFQARTVRQLAKLLRGRSAVTKWSSLVPIRTVGKHLPVFCVHGIGGNVLGYQDFLRHIPADQPVYLIQSKGLHGNEDPLRSIPEIAAHYLSEVRAVQPEGPYYLAGYSFGGVVAFEMAQQLRSVDEQVALLAMFDSDRPNYKMSWMEKVRNQVDHIAKLKGRDRPGYILSKLGLVWARLVGRKPAARAQLKESVPEQMRDVRKANREALAAYRAKPYDGKVTLFMAGETGISGARARNLGWTDVSLGGLDRVSIPGNHINILYEPNVATAVEQLVVRLDAARRVHAQHTRERPIESGPADREVSLVTSNGRESTKGARRDS